jgi:hypothetical protein
MIRLRLAGAVLFAAAFAGCITFYVTAPPRVEAEQRLVLIAPDPAGSPAGKPTKTGPQAEDYERAAAALLKRLTDAQASARADELPIIGHIPLPKKRPIPR